MRSTPSAFPSAASKVRASAASQSSSTQRPARASKPAGVSSHQRARAQHGDPIAEGLGLVHVVGGEEHRLALGAQEPQVGPDLMAGFDVHPERGLVEHQERRVVQERAGDGQPSLHPAGEAADGLAGAIGEADHLQHLLDARLRVGHVVQGSGEAQVLPGAHLFIERGLLWHETPRAAAPRETGERRLHRNTRTLPEVGAGQAAHRINEVVLPAPFGPTTPSTWPSGRVRRESVERGRLSEPAHQGLNDDRGDGI